MSKQVYDPIKIRVLRDHVRLCCENEIANEMKSSPYLIKHFVAIYLIAAPARWLHKCVRCVFGWQVDSPVGLARAGHECPPTFPLYFSSFLFFYKLSYPFRIWKPQCEITVVFIGERFENNTVRGSNGLRCYADFCCFLRFSVIKCGSLVVKLSVLIWDVLLKTNSLNVFINCTWK